MVQQLKKTETLFEKNDSWDEVSCASHDDLEAHIGRLAGDCERDLRVRIGRRGEMNPGSTLQLRTWELPKLAGLVQWTADAVSVLPTIRQTEADDMGCLAACLGETLGRLTRRTVLRLDLDSPVADAFRTVVDCLLEEQAMSFASDSCMEHAYRRILLIDRWLAGASTLFIDDGFEQVDFDEFGACPLCCSQDGHFNIQRAHWFVCHKHRVCWCPGENLFSDWRQESEADWQANVTKLKGYRMVEPLRREPVTL